MSPDRPRASPLTAHKNKAMRDRTRTSINLAIILLNVVIISQELALALAVSLVRYRGARGGPAASGTSQATVLASRML